MLNIEEIKSIAFGADNITQKDEYFLFSRFSDGERKSYANEPALFAKTYSTAGIKFDFSTDGHTLVFSYHFSVASSRRMAFFDVYLNDALYESIGKLNAPPEFDGDYRLDLPEGENRVTIYFPNLFSMQIKNFDIKDYTVLKPLKKELSIASYGDSITQGYDAVLPSYSYINKTAKALNASVCNKAIGADMFRPDLLTGEISHNYDIVTVAYGTNDWKNRERKCAEKLTPLFFDLLDNQYNNSKVIIITPIWRKDSNIDSDFGKFEEMTFYLQNLAALHSRFICINGLEIFPHNEVLFSDGYLHPNDIGMEIYAENLLYKIKEYI